MQIAPRHQPPRWTCVYRGADGREGFKKRRRRKRRAELVGARCRRRLQSSIHHRCITAADKGYPPPVAACKGFWSRAKPPRGRRQRLYQGLSAASLRRCGPSGSFRGISAACVCRLGVRGAAVERGEPALSLSPGWKTFRGGHLHPGGGVTLGWRGGGWGLQCGRRSKRAEGELHLRWEDATLYSPSRAAFPISFSPFLSSFTCSPADADSSACRVGNEAAIC